MCDASSLGTWSQGMQAVGVATQASAAANKSRLDRAAYEYQAKVADNNAQLAEMQARDAIVRGQTAEGNSRLRTAALEGRQRAAIAANGVDLTEGSPLNILTDTKYMGDLDANVIKDNAAREAWGFRTQKQNFESNAGLFRMRAGAENPAGAAANTLLTGAGRVASNWYNLSSKSVNY